MSYDSGSGYRLNRQTNPQAYDMIAKEDSTKKALFATNTFEIGPFEQGLRNFGLFPSAVLSPAIS